jgi:hypothetical protein
MWLGVEIEASDEQQEKTRDSMRHSLDSDGKMTSRRLAQDSKHPSERTATQCGMQIDASDEHARNAPDSMRQSLDGDSNITS